jgi:hypothetical protein
MRKVAATIVASGLLALLATNVALGHGSREVDGYQLEVGFIDEPVAAGQRSGLELEATGGGQPVQGLEQTLIAEVLYGDHSLDLPIDPRSGAPGWYESVFTPSAAGQYTFHISGTIGGTQIDERFTSGVDGFDDVSEAAGGQFPVQLPSLADVAEDAKRGAEATDLVRVATTLGAVGAITGLLALGIALGVMLAGRRSKG